MLLRSFKNRLRMAWRMMYHWARRCFGNLPDGSILKQPSLAEEFSTNRITIVTSCVILAGAVTVRAILPPYVSLGSLFVFGCAIPTLVISRRWGTIAAMSCAFAVSLVRIHLHLEPFHVGTFLWNVVMRFLFFEAYVVIFDHVRRQANALPGGGSF
jgi:hypothetical protein